MARPAGERRLLARSGRRAAVTVAGTSATAVGVVMLFLPPLPGIAVTLAGLALLATEYDWADRWLARAKERFRRDDGGDPDHGARPPDRPAQQ